MKQFLKVLALIKPYKWICLLALFWMMVYLVLTSVSITAMIPLIDKVLSNQAVTVNVSLPFPSLQKYLDQIIAWINRFDSMGLLRLISTYFILATLLKGLSQYIQVLLMELIGQRIARDLRVRLFNKYFLLPARYFSGNRTGDLISKITNDVMVVQMFFSGHFTTTILGSIHFFPCVAYVFLVEWKMALICLVVIPLCMTPIIIVGHQIRKISRKGQENISDISSSVYEILGALKVVKIFGQSEKEKAAFKNICNRSVKLRVKSKKREAILSPITEFVGVGASIFLLWNFAPRLIQGEISLGTFLVYFGCIASMIKPVKTFGKIQAMLQNALASSDRIFQLLEEDDEKCEIQGEKLEIGLKDSIEFKNVSFSYEEGNKVLDSLDLKIPRGRMIALVGPSGSGKSTIAHLIPRFFDPQEGDILIDGKNMKEIHVNGIRKLIGMVSQDPVLFNTSVFENIRYGKPEASKEQVIEAAKVARADIFIEKMSEGYDTQIGERGICLSGGEKQRIAIARAILRDPEILIFDEATSALDAENEKLVQEAIDKAVVNRTVIVIAHRLSTVVKSHEIIVLDKGKIVQQGSHETLMEQKGLYRHLYELNFSI